MKPLRPPKTAPNGGYLNRDLLGVGLGGGGRGGSLGGGPGE